MAKDGPRIDIPRRPIVGTGCTNASATNRRTALSTLELRTYDLVPCRHVVVRERDA